MYHIGDSQRSQPKDLREDENKIKKEKKNRSDKNGVASAFVLYGYFVEACLLQVDNTTWRVFCKINSYKSNNKKR